MRRTRIALAAVVLAVVGGVAGLAPSAQAKPKNPDICTGPIDEIGENGQPTGYFWINCSGRWYRYQW